MLWSQKQMRNRRACKNYSHETEVTIFQVLSDIDNKSADENVSGNALWETIQRSDLQQFTAHWFYSKPKVLAKNPGLLDQVTRYCEKPWKIEKRMKAFESWTKAQKSLQYIYLSLFETF